MKKFKFNLQVVHALRESQRDREERELARLMAAVTDATDVLHQLQMSRTDATDKFSARLSRGTIDAVDAALSTRYISSLLAREHGAQAEVGKCKWAVEQQRFKLAEAACKAKATERLHDTQKQRYELDNQRAEQTALDETATLARTRQLAQERQ
jgi:flagellar export protein FliJ